MFAVLPTFVCEGMVGNKQCGWVAGVDEQDHIYCSNPKCSHYGRLFKIEIVINEVKAVGV